MPKIFEYFGFIFYFYSNEHEPIHVHVLHGGKESIFELIMMNGELVDIHIREKHGAEPQPYHPRFDPFLSFPAHF